MRSKPSTVIETRDKLREREILNVNSSRLRSASRALALKDGQACSSSVFEDGFREHAGARCGDRARFKYSRN